MSSRRLFYLILLMSDRVGSSLLSHRGKPEEAARGLRNELRLEPESASL